MDLAQGVRPSPRKGLTDMICRSIFKIIGLIAGAVIGLAALAVIAVVAYFIYGLAVPEKMDITGRVMDSRGQPVEGIKVRAVPLSLHDPYSDSAKDPQDTEHTAISDENGRYRFKRLVASVGVKEDRCMQGYDITACRESWSSAPIRACKHPDDRSGVIELADLIIAEQGGSAAGGGGS